MKQFIEAGEFVTTHGVMGELKLYPWCDGPEFVAALPRLFFTPEGGRETKVEAVRAHKGMCLVKLKGVDSIDAARPYIRKVAYFSRADVKIAGGTLFCAGHRGLHGKGRGYRRGIRCDHCGGASGSH